MVTALITCSEINDLLRFQESGECVSKLSGNSDGKEILVPLTGSMYVPGTLVESEKVIIVSV